MKINPRLIIVLFVTVALILSCATENNRMRGNYKIALPGVYPINDTLFCDQTEHSNFQWLEYLYWTERCFGKNSEELKNALPNDSIWVDFDCLKDRKENEYYRHPSYRDYPLVGITQQQARNFAQWRSDRVFEYLLVKKGILAFDVTQDSSRYFTIERYFKGEHRVPAFKGDTSVFKFLVPDLSILYPEYRLPTLADRALILDYVDSTEFLYHTRHPKKEAKAMAVTAVFQLAIQPCATTKTHPNDTLPLFLRNPMRPIESAVQHDNQISILYNIRGNAAEWVEEPNVTVGGGWPHNVQYVLQKDTITANSANAWTSFRCVAQWKKYTP